MIGQNLGIGADALEEFESERSFTISAKIGVPDAILNKPGRLTEEEFLFMKSHPVIATKSADP